MSATEDSDRGLLLLVIVAVLLTVGLFLMVAITGMHGTYNTALNNVYTTVSVTNSTSSQ